MTNTANKSSYFIMFNIDRNESSVYIYSKRGDYSHYDLDDWTLKQF